MSATPTGLTELTCAQFNDLVGFMGEPGLRTKQLRKWVCRSLAFSFDEMTDLPLAFRQRLASEARLHSLETEQAATGKDGTLKVR